jgi:hypothetical protein
MRDGLEAPTELPSADELARLRAFLDGQARIDLAVWVRHRHDGPQGMTHDHHLVLGVANEDAAGSDLWALECGIGSEVSLPGWLDIGPVSEVEALRSFGVVVWERRESPRSRLDPLEFRFTHDAPTATPELVRAATVAVEAVPWVRRVEISNERLWKGAREVWLHERLFVVGEGLPPRGDPVRAVSGAMKALGVRNVAVSLGDAPEGTPTTTVFAAPGEARA